jgi:hypothetical protein
MRKHKDNGEQYLFKIAHMIIFLVAFHAGYETVWTEGGREKSMVGSDSDAYSYNCQLNEIEGRRSIRRDYPSFDY